MDRHRTGRHPTPGRRARAVTRMTAGRTSATRTGDRTGRSPTAGRRTRAGRTRPDHPWARRRWAHHRRAHSIRAGLMPAARAVACRTVLLSTARPHTVRPSKVLRRTVRPRTVLPRTVLPRTMLPREALLLPLIAGLARTGGRPPTAQCRTPGQTPAGPTVVPAACRDLAGIGCRTGGGCHRGRTACTGRRDRPRRAAPRAGTMGPGQRSRSTTRTAGADRAQHRRVARFPAARVREAPVQEAPSQAVPFLELLALEVPVRVASVPALMFPAALVRAGLVRAGLVREVALRGPVRGDRARAPRTGVHRRTAGLARPGSPDLRHQEGQAGLRRCASTRRPGRASRRRTDVTGPARRRSHRVR